MIKLKLPFFLLTLFILFSCKNDETIYINLYHNESEPSLTMLKAQTELFQSRQNGVEFRLIKMSTDELTRRSAELEPGIIRAPSSYITLESVQSRLLELSGLFPENELAPFHPEALQTMKVDNLLYGIPDTLGGTVSLFYNRTLMKKEEPVTPKRLKAIKWEISRGMLPRYLMVFDQYDPYLLYPLFNSTGKRLSTREDFLNFYDKKLLFIYQMLYELIVNEMLIPINCDSRRAEELFFSGEALMLLSYSSNYDRYRQRFRKELGVMSLPSFYSKNIIPASWARTEGYAVMNSIEAENLEIIKDYITFMSSREVQSAWLELERAPSLSSLLEDNSSDTNISILTGSHAAPPGSIYEPFFKIVIDELQQMYHNRISPETAAHNSALKLRELLNPESED